MISIKIINIEEEMKGLNDNESKIIKKFVKFMQRFFQITGFCSRVIVHTTMNLCFRIKKC